MRFLIILVAALFMVACGTTPPPRPVEKIKIVAVTVPKEAFEMEDVPMPMDRDEYLSLTKEEEKVADTVLIQNLYGTIKQLRLQVRGIYKTMMINKETLESENK